MIVTYNLCIFSFFFFNDTATTEIYTLSLHDALPIWIAFSHYDRTCVYLLMTLQEPYQDGVAAWQTAALPAPCRSEEHTSELQSRQYLVCRLLLEKKKKK